MKSVNHRWRKIFCVALSAVLFALCSSAEAQQTGKVFRIGFLDPSTSTGTAVMVDAFRQEMNKLGWIEGKNITIEYRFAENKGADRLSALASDLVRLQVDSHRGYRSRPKRCGEEADDCHPHRDGDLCGPGRCWSGRHLARRGGNVTGLSSLVPELNSKRLELLKDTVPKLTRVGFLFSGVSAELQLRELRPAVLALNLKLEEIEAQPDPKGLESAFQTAKQKRVDAIMTTPVRSFFAERKRIVELAGKYRLPAIYFQKEFVDEGGLMSYGVDYDDLFRRSAHYVDKILKGAKPADLPVQQATKFEFIINLKAANQIGLTIPVLVVERANQVIR